MTFLLFFVFALQAIFVTRQDIIDRQQLPGQRQEEDMDDGPMLPERNQPGFE
ncbi:MAG: hypothetical protein QM775_07570 [Pirellulales bacterium]